MLRNTEDEYKEIQQSNNLNFLPWYVQHITLYFNLGYWAHKLLEMC